jgi:hypothetical protein
MNGLSTRTRASIHERRDAVRKVLCPHCGITGEYRGEAPLRCRVCGTEFFIEKSDRQDLRFVCSSDGYHCWQSQPTAYHTIYACKGYPVDCRECIHSGRTFCIDGRVDFRLPFDAVIHGVEKQTE